MKDTENIWDAVHTAPSGVVVTGATGFIGSQVVDDLRRERVRVLAIDDLSTGNNPIPRDPMVSFLQTSFDSERALSAIAEFAPRVIVHLAALHYLPYCRSHPAETTRVNVSATKRLLDGLHRVGSLRRFIFASSAAVYGFSEDRITERSALQPVDVYGESKSLGERLVREFAASSDDTSAVVLRFFNVFGPRETNPHLIPSLVLQIAADSVVTIGNGWPQRDYVHVTDVSSAVRLSMDAAMEDTHGTFNIATGRGTSVVDVLDLLAMLWARHVTWRVDPTKIRSVDGHLVGTGALARANLHWEPRHSLETGLAELLRQELIAL